MPAAAAPRGVALASSALRPTMQVGTAPARVLPLPASSSSSVPGTSSIPRTPLPTRPALAPRLEAAVASVAGPAAIAPSRILPAPVTTRPGLMRSSFAASSPSLVRPGVGSDDPVPLTFDGSAFYASPAAFGAYGGGGSSSSSSWADDLADATTQAADVDLPAPMQTRQLVGVEAPLPVWLGVVAIAAGALGWHLYRSRR